MPKGRRLESDEEEMQLDGAEENGAEGESLDRRAEYVGGRTQLGGHSNQKVQSMAWKGEINESTAVTFHAFLLARK